MNIVEIFMPQLGVNDETVVLRQWFVQAGEKVNVGERVALLETSKAAVTLEAEHPGYYYPLVETGAELPVRSRLAVVLDRPDPDAVKPFETPTGGAGAGDRTPGDASHHELTARAKELIASAGVDLSQLPRGRVIRERDVIDLLKAQQRAGATAGPSTAVLRSALRHGVRPVAVYGASEGGLVVAEMIRAMGGHEARAFVDDTPGLAGTLFAGLPVLAGGELDRLAGLGIDAMASHIARRDFRLVLRDRARAVGITLINVIHPNATVSPSARLGVGNLVKAGAVLDTDVRVGDCCIIDNGAIVPHHNTLRDACHLAPGVAMGGGCTIGERTLIGVGSVVASRIRIGRNVIVQPGSVVVADVPDDAIVGGNPARVIGERR